VSREAGGAGARLVLATRRSPLALAQSRAVAAILSDAGYMVELLELVTSGDRWSAEAAPGAPAPDKGLFVKELEVALLDGRADVAVHSAKDLPADLPPGLGVVATPPREDPGDVLVGAARIEDLAPGARVGTGSPRRAAQLRSARGDLDVAEIRGNVGTRLARWEAGEFDAIVLARAGLARLGLDPAPAGTLPGAVMVPAPGQGVLAIEARSDHPLAPGMRDALDDPATAACLRAERSALRALGGGCRAPVGALAQIADGVLRLRGFRADDEAGAGARRAQVAGPPGDAEALGERLARELAA
jgi:hydroxymethylbilane synthase